MDWSFTLPQELANIWAAADADFSMWTGISLTVTRAIWTRQQSDFAPVHVVGWDGLRWLVVGQDKILMEIKHV